MQQEQGKLLLFRGFCGILGLGFTRKGGRTVGWKLGVLLEAQGDI